jgi:predicted transcriptional regulator
MTTIASVVTDYLATNPVSAADALALLRAAAEALRGHAYTIQLTGVTEEMLAAIGRRGEVQRATSEDGTYDYARIRVGKGEQYVEIAACRKVEP